MRRGKTPKYYTACLKIKLWVIKLDSGKNTGTQDEKKNKKLKRKAEDCRKHLDNRGKNPTQTKTNPGIWKRRVQTL